MTWNQHTEIFLLLHRHGTSSAKAAEKVRAAFGTWSGLTKFSDQNIKDKAIANKTHPEHLHFTMNFLADATLDEYLE